MNRSWMLFLLPVLFPSVALGGESASARTAPELGAREWVNAPDGVTVAGSRGKVLLVVWWGMRCGVCQCGPVLRKLVPLHRKHASQGLVVVAMHVHEATQVQLDAWALKNGIEYPMGNGGANRAWGVEQVPRAFLVDPGGTIVWEGADLGGDFSRQLSLCLRGVDLLGEASLPRSLAAVKQLVARRQLGKAIARLIDFATDPDTPAEEADAARAFQKKLEHRGEREYLRAASALRTKDPFRGVPILERLAVEYKDQPAGRKAAARLKEIREEEDLAGPLAAAELYGKLRSLLRGGNERAAATVAQRLLRAHPESIYARMTENLLAAYNEMD